MERILPWLALVLAATIAVIAVIELDNRADEDDSLAVPTFLQPTPSAPADGAAETSEPVDETPARTRVTSPPAAPQRTATPPRTPTPAPEITPGPADRSRGPTPRTGGNATPTGLLIATLAMVVRTQLVRRTRSY